MNPQNPIAIIGIGCRFPGGIADPDGFWRLVVSGTDAIVDVPADRWRAGNYFDPDPEAPGRTFVRQGGFLTGPVDVFDAGFFGMPPRDAAALDPQQRLLLEVTWEAFEDAGLPMGAVAGQSVGSYIGGFTFDAAHLELAEANRHLVSSATPTGVSMTMLAARLSYAFDWRGPSLTIDTACSSSLVALHHACTALSRGECTLAVAGGVNVMIDPVTTVLMSKGQFLSPDGRCKSFDHRADGYARAEGAGVVLLKPLADARRDRDRIYAVVRGTAVNQDGRTPGITVPSAAAQRAVVAQACRSGAVDPLSIGYFEAHGTGTAVGDPIEASALGAMVAGSGRTHWIGSVKSNFGHAEAAAGIAGVIKAGLTLRNQVIAPNLHFERPNPKIPFDRLPLRVPTAAVPFPRGTEPRRVGVNSFGFGGTNAHAVLEEAPDEPTPAAEDPADPGPALLPLSARSRGALETLGAAYADLLRRPEANFRRICRATARQRDHHPIRTFVVADDATDAADRIGAVEPPGAPGRPGIAFVYTGMGPQWWGMGAELLSHEPRFAAVVAECDAILERFGLCMADELGRDEKGSRLTGTLHAQVGNFVVQAGLTALWRDWGIEPMAIVGHSVGEVAAAYAAGVFSLRDALTIGYHRASLQARLAGGGGMAAVDAAEHEVLPHLTDGVCVAAVNSAGATTLAGDGAALAAVGARLAAAGMAVKPLRVEVAYHSGQMDRIREEILRAVAGIRPRTAAVPLFSTVTGERVDGAELTADYWWRNVRRPVRFAQAMRRLLSVGPGAVLEVGPHPVLAGPIHEALADRGQRAAVLPSLRRDRPQRRTLLETAGALYVAGNDPCWERLHPGPRVPVRLPHYPWQRERHWLESRASRAARLGVDGPALAGRPVPAAVPTRDNDLSGALFPFLSDHRIGDTVVFPGSGYLEAALALFADETPCVLENIVLHRPLTLPAKEYRSLRSTYDPRHRLVTMHSRELGAEDGWTLHAQMRHAEVTGVLAADPVPDDAGPSSSLPHLGHDELYTRLDGSGLNYGPAFRAVDQLWYDAAAREVVAELRTDTVDTSRYRLHPVLLDAALQAMIAGALQIGRDAAPATFVPARIAEFRFLRSPGRRLWVRGRDRGSPVPGRLECDLTLYTDEGDVVAEVIGLRAQALASAATEPTAATDLYYENVWHRADLDESGSAAGKWIVVAAAGRGRQLAEGLSARGADVRLVVTAADWPREVADAVAAEPDCRGVTYVADAPRAEAAACAPAVDPLRLVRALSGAPAPLRLVTTGAQSVGGADPTTDPFGAAIWGFGRVVAAEHPDLRCRLIDVTPAPHVAGAGIEELVDELLRDDSEEVALREEGRYVRRLERAGDRSAVHHVRVDAGETPVRLVAGRPGLASLGFAGTGRRAPGPGEVEIAVSHVGVNFKDVMKVMGVLPSEAMEGSHSGPTLGLECAGTIVRVGAAVTELRVGDEVFAHGRDLFASYTTLEQVRVVPRPRSLTPAQAASLLPVATARFSLVDLARVRPGDGVLVHSAAGGVGLAAVRIARWLGARVYATAGTEERREFLRREGVAGVADSRSTSFATEIRRMTGGEGVDVVLNSLPGEFLHKSLGLLRPFGRFVELGKADIAADEALRLAPFQHSLSFHSLDYDEMMRLAPERVRAGLFELARLYDEGAFTPLPVTEVAAEDVEDAFRAMTRRDHIGKLVVGMGGRTVMVPARSAPAPPVRPDGAYLVTGGLGGLGLAVARWLAGRGARRLVLAGRHGAASPPARAAVAELTRQGVHVQVATVDVSRPELVAGMVARARAELGPLRGVVHAAADFDDAVLAAFDPERFLAATRPKADGAWQLHQATAGDELDFFVLFSSVAAQLGAGGAGAYATANEFLNGLARYRAGRGLPATSVGWGMVSDVGVAVSRNGTVMNVLRRNGHGALSPAQLIEELETVLRTRPAEVSVANVEWPRWARANPQLARLPQFASLAPADAGAAGGGSAAVPRRLRDASPKERGELLPGLVAPFLQRVTGLTDDQLENQAVDIDSLAAVELRVLLENGLGIAVPPVKLQRSLTVDRLAELLAAELERVPTPQLVGGITMHELTSADGLTVYGHLSVPPGPGPHPAVVVCRAGAGGALAPDGGYAHVAEHGPLHAGGFAVFTVDQRGAPGHGAEYGARSQMGGADIDDVVAAARYLADRPEIDAGRVSVLGTSRGGYSALLALAREPSRWHRAVLVMGLYDPAHLVTAERTRPGSLLPQETEVDADALAAYFADPRRRPLAALPEVTTPLLVVHGDADDVIPVEQAVELTERARGHGLSTRLVTVPGLGHDDDYTDATWAGVWPEIVDFLTEAPDETQR